MAILPMTAVAPAALAHDEIVGTSPANEETVAAAPEEVRIEFSEQTRPTSGEGTISGPGGDRMEAGPARLDGTTLVIPMRDTTDSGRFTVEFSVVSSDGHPVSGSIGFEVTEPPPATTTAAPATSKVEPAHTSREPDSGGPWWPWLVALGVAGAGAAAAVSVLRRRRGAD
ncbi:MAG: copper resistance CopC family protein [Natronosporangium sp.]